MSSERLIFETWIVKTLDLLVRREPLGELFQFSQFCTNSTCQNTQKCNEIYLSDPKLIKLIVSILITDTKFENKSTNLSTLMKADAINITKSRSIWIRCFIKGEILLATLQREIFL